MYKIRSKQDAEYAALEEYIDSKFLRKVNGQATTELYLAEKTLNKEQLEDLVSGAVGSHNKSTIEYLMNALGSDECLPTSFDDPLSYSIASDLMKSVQSAADLFGLPTAGYGGFCCAPTGRVNAQAVPIRVHPAPSKVFIVFESGLFTFVHGIISNIVETIPRNLLEGSTLSDWKLVWNDFIHDEKNATKLEADAAAIKAWKSFFRRYDRSELSYIGHDAMGPTAVRLVAGMTKGCEVFIAAHEFVHAISGHQDPTLDAAAVEREADQLGSEITAKVLAKEGIPPIYACVGIAIFLLAIEFHDLIDHAHLPAQQRISLILNGMFKGDPQLESIARDVVELFTLIFKDLIGWRP